MFEIFKEGQLQISSDVFLCLSMGPVKINNCEGGADPKRQALSTDLQSGSVNKSPTSRHSVINLHRAPQDLCDLSVRVVEEFDDCA